METHKMTPFVKWVGGKTQLLDRLIERVPNTYNRYFEPFLGGGAMLLALKPKKAIVGDINEQLINIYKQLKQDPREIIKLVNSYDKTICNKEFYYEMREKYNQKILSGEIDVECASLLIWLNKHCFNGLYRVNNKGLFNVPYNNKESGKSINDINLMNIGYYLSNNDIDIRCQDFECVCEDVKEGDFVYFDSPYIPINETSSFVDYTKDGFSLEEHKRLATLFRELDKRGAKCMLSNHNVELVYELYQGFNIEVVDVRRNINSKGDKRVGKEVIITNYTN